jgi:hypothetical protein
LPIPAADVPSLAFLCDSSAALAYAGQVNFPHRVESGDSSWWPPSQHLFWESETSQVYFSAQPQSLVSSSSMPLFSDVLTQTHVANHTESSAPPLTTIFFADYSAHHTKSAHNKQPQNDGPCPQIYGQTVTSVAPPAPPRYMHEHCDSVSQDALPPKTSWQPAQDSGNNIETMLPLNFDDTCHQSSTAGFNSADACASSASSLPGVSSLTSTCFCEVSEPFNFFWEDVNNLLETPSTLL